MGLLLERGFGDRRFKADGPNQLWVADCHVRCPPGGNDLPRPWWLDVWSTRIVGWAIEDHLRTELMLGCLEPWRAPTTTEEVIHHSDHGCQYTSYAIRQSRCQEMNVMPSNGDGAMPTTNAMRERVRILAEGRLPQASAGSSRKAEAACACFEWIEGWYNPHRASLSSIALVRRTTLRARLFGRDRNENLANYPSTEAG